MMVILENRLDALVRLHTPLPPARIGGAHDRFGGPSNLGLESFYGPNAGLSEVLIPAGYVTTVYDPVFALSPERTRYLPVAAEHPTELPAPGLPFSLVFRAEPGREESGARNRLLLRGRLQAPHPAPRLRPASLIAG